MNHKNAGKRSNIFIFLRDRDGQSTVEFMLVLPLALFLTLALCQVAVALNCLMVVTAASREGARMASMSNNAEEGKRAALEASKGLPGERPAVSVCFPEGRDKGDQVKVQLEYKMPYLFPGVDKLVPNPTFRQSTSMSLEKGT